MIKRCSRSWHERTNRLGRKKSRIGTMDHCKKTNGHSYNERFSFSMEKLNSKQNMNPKVAATNEYMRVSSWMTPPGNAPMGSNTIDGRTTQKIVS